MSCLVALVPCYDRLSLLIVIASSLISKGYHGLLRNTELSIILMCLICNDAHVVIAPAAHPDAAPTILIIHFAHNVF